LKPTPTTEELSRALAYTSALFGAGCAPEKYRNDPNPADTIRAALNASRKLFIEEAKRAGALDAAIIETARHIGANTSRHGTDAAQWTRDQIDAHKRTITEQRRRAERAERDRDHWKEQATARRGARPEGDTTAPAAPPAYNQHRPPAADRQPTGNTPGTPPDAERRP